MTIRKQKVAVAMSGGVDSSVAAALLQKAGYEVIGIFMQFWFPEGEQYGENRCCSLESFNEASEVAKILDIPIHKLNFGQPFKKLVVDEFISAYQTGQTPNPCINCNKFIKFDLLWQKAHAMFDVDFLATGHYARIKEEALDGRKIYHLLRGADPQKDQSYFLYNLNQDILPHLMFPVGDYEKKRVRTLAKKFNLPVHDKPDSQEVCFVGLSHKEFLKNYLKPKDGKIITNDNLASSARGVERSETGGTANEVGCLDDRDLRSAQLHPGQRPQVLGEHEGLALYTIGQREGIRLSGGPWYVCGFDRKKNYLIVTKDQQNSKIYQTEAQCQNVNWVVAKPELPFTCHAQIRYHTPEANCLVTDAGQGINLKFTAPQRAIMPGQSAVLYDEEEVLGGGIIG